MSTIGEHVWAKITYTPLDVLVDEDGLSLLSRLAAGRETKTVQGCMVCDIHLDVETFNTTCPGPEGL